MPCVFRNTSNMLSWAAVDLLIRVWLIYFHLDWEIIVRVSLLGVPGSIFSFLCVTAVGPQLLKLRLFESPRAVSTMEIHILAFPLCLVAGSIVALLPVVLTI